MVPRCPKIVDSAYQRSCLRARECVYLEFGVWSKMAAPCSWFDRSQLYFEIAWSAAGAYGPRLSYNLCQCGYDCGLYDFSLRCRPFLRLRPQRYSEMPGGSPTRKYNENHGHFPQSWFFWMGGTQWHL